MTSTAIKERPILFNGDMVRALLNGTKTHTRRPCKLTESGRLNEIGGHRNWHPGDPDSFPASPFGVPGDRLYVRETWAGDDMHGFVYRADHPNANLKAGDLDDADSVISYWQPSIHMPRWASRITLEVARVWVERVQDISEDDALAEGVNRIHHGDGDYYFSAIRDTHHQDNWCSAYGAYEESWDSIYAKKYRNSWGENPWVWCCEFKIIKKGVEPDA